MNPRVTLIALFCLFALSLASHAPPETVEPSTQVFLINGKDSTPAVSDLTKIPIRLVNRRFPIRSKRPCRHHHMKNRHAEAKIVDMFPGGENGDFEEPIVSGVGWRIPGRWLGPSRRHDRGEGFDRVGREKGIRVLKKVEKSSLVRRVRKFLDNYF